MTITPVKTPSTRAWRADIARWAWLFAPRHDDPDRRQVRLTRQPSSAGHHAGFWLTITDADRSVVELHLYADKLPDAQRESESALRALDGRYLDEWIDNGHETPPR